MGDLAADTAVEALGDGRYRGVLSRDWEIWGPMGGYLASFALRAAGEESRFNRPASFFCHYLHVAAFEPIDVQVSTLRSAKTALSQRVTISQGARQVLEATVWSVGEVEGLEHDDTESPAVPPPDGLPSIEELTPDREAPFRFWNNFDMRPVTFRAQWPPAESLPPQWRAWCRFRPMAVFDDPWVDACRSVILVDVQSWPAASSRHAWREPHGFIAPSLDLYVAFHLPVPEEPWLLADGFAPVSADGIFGWTGRLWTPGGQLVSSGAGQALYRRVPSTD
ncbi:MAG TPA: thioesterase family protein [Acidimicrobiales bacterium]